MIRVVILAPGVWMGWERRVREETDAADADNVQRTVQCIHATPCVAHAMFSMTMFFL